MEKRQKRMQQVIDHLLGTALPLSGAMTTAERDDASFCADILSQIKQNSTTHKWERYDPA